MPKQDDNRPQSGQGATSKSRTPSDKNRDRDGENQGSGKEAGRPRRRGVPNESSENTEHSGQPAGHQSDGDEDVNSMPSTKRHVPGGPDEDTRNPG